MHQEREGESAKPDGIPEHVKLFIDSSKNEPTVEGVIYDITAWQVTSQRHVDEEETDLDPTLVKVAHVHGWRVLRDLARQLVRLGLVATARGLTDISDRLIVRPVDVLEGLSIARSDLRQKFGGGIALLPRTFQPGSLAEIRAVFIAMRPDTSGEPVVDQAEVAELLKKPAAELDKLFVATAKRLGLPLPKVNTSELDPKTSDKPTFSETEFENVRTLIGEFGKDTPQKKVVSEYRKRFRQGARSGIRTQKIQAILDKLRGLGEYMAPAKKRLAGKR